VGDGGRAQEVAVEVRRLWGQREATVTRVDTSKPLLEALEAAGVALPHRCREARCGRCRARVVGGQAALAPAGPAERARLGPALARGERLLCQARVANSAVGGAPGVRPEAVILEV
jgi:ferredoxin